MKFHHWLAACVVAMSAVALRAQPPRLAYDSQCLTIDGHDTLIFSGAFHYFRCPKPLWADRFRKLKEAGFNTVETYAAWNWHEQTPPADVDDFSHLDMTDLHDWLAMAIDDFGFNVILRPGPYICAEWDGGGYPQWLVTKKPAGFDGVWLRSDDPTYLAWSKHWYAAVAKVAVPFQITHRPAGKSGIILWQIENESNYAPQRPEIMHGQLSFLAHASRDLGIDVPLTTCMTSSDLYRKDEFLRANVVETRNTYPGYSTASMERDIGVLDTYQPEKFHMVTELQGGWFLGVGSPVPGAKPVFSPDQIIHITLYAWERGFTSTNYYMAFGGTNFGDWGAAGLATSYDYEAPIHETGGVGERYLAVKSLGDFLKLHADELVRARSEKIVLKSAPIPGISISARRAKGNSRFIFVRNDDEKTPHHGTATISPSPPETRELTFDFDLAPFASKILFLPPNATAGVWYPQAAQGPVRPAESDIPAAIRITECRTHDEAGPSDWKPLDNFNGLPFAGIEHRNFVFYRTVIPTLPDTSNPDSIAIIYSMRAGDWVGFNLDGQRLQHSPNSSAVILPPGASGKSLVALYENIGRANGGGLDDTPGLTDLSIAPFHAVQNLKRWRMKIVTDASSTKELHPDTDDSTWPLTDTDADAVQLQPGQIAVFRGSFTLDPAAAGAMHDLCIGRIDDDGDLYLNGKMIAHTGDWSRSYRIWLPENSLRPGTNQLAVRVINHDGPGGLGLGVRVESRSTPLAAKWEISDQSEGIANHWIDADVDDSSWKKVAIGAAPPANSATPPLLTWHRLHFALPARREHVWVPWKLHLAANGNGFLYLNGHSLGRYWQAGGQHDFYLPECWLNFGADQSNVIVVNLRATDSASIQSAEVRPYADHAEVR